MSNSNRLAVVLILILCFLYLKFYIKSSPGNNRPSYGHNYDVDTDPPIVFAKSTGSVKLVDELPIEEDEGDVFRNMKMFSEKQSRLRKKKLNEVLTDKKFISLYGSLTSEVFCPEKVRIGPVGEGGKWVCNPWKTPNNSAFFSLSVTDRLDFETDWIDATSNKTSVFKFFWEKTSQRFSDSRVKNQEIKIPETTSSEDGTSTISDLMKTSNVTRTEFLKIDIEGAEKTCLMPFLEKYTICQLFMTLYGGAEEHASFLQKIAHLNYRLFSYEVNGSNVTVADYSFLHVTCVDKYGGIPISNFLDFFN